MCLYLLFIKESERKATRSDNFKTTLFRLPAENSNGNDSDDGR